MNIKDKIITIHINIEDRHATYQEAPAKLVCGNPLRIIFSFDEEWEEFANVEKRARLVFWRKGKKEHIVIGFKGNECSVPALFGIKNVEIGVFIENDICTTTGAFIECEKSILCDTSTSVFGPDEIDNINKALVGKDGETPYIGENGNWWIAGVDTELPSRGDDGPPGIKGDKGDTPAKGVDYFTDEDKAEIVEEVTTACLGDIDAALDELHAYAQSLVGGGAV